MKNYDDIKDDEIRIIGKQTIGNNHFKRFIVAAIFVIAAVTIILFYVLRLSREEYGPNNQVEGIYENEHETELIKDSLSNSKSFVTIEDIKVGNDSLRIYIPTFSKVFLSVGTYDFQDTSVVFVCQAADVRKDNLKILGDFVLNGEILAYGHSKWGWCSIINNEISLGCEKEPKALQDAIEMKGSFFRQFGLVLEGKYIKDTNNKKYCSIRRAICQIKGSVIIVESLSQVSLFDFAKMLESYGVDNAIALVGNETYGYAIDEKRNKVEFGRLDSNWIFESTSYIIFK